MTRVRKIYFFFTALLAVGLTGSLCPRSFATPNLSGLSPEWIEHLHFDWNFNNVNRSRMEEYRVQDVDVYLVEPSRLRNLEYLRALVPVPLGAVRDFYSPDQFLVFVDDGKDPVQWLKAQKGAGPSRFRAVKIQSWSTYLVWDPADPGSGPFFVKADGWGGTQATMMTDYLARQISKGKNINFDILSEPISVSGTAGPAKFSITYRPSVSVLQKEGDPPLVPSHGYLNQRHYKEFEDWKISRFVPKFARAVAQLNYRFGVFHCTHAQNTLLRVSTAPGGEKDVSKIVFRDLRDTYLNPLLLLEKKLVPTHFFYSDVTRINRPFGIAAPDKDSRNTEAGYFLWNYVFQTFENAFGTDPIYIRRAIGAFVLSYVEETEKIFGQKFSFSDATLENIRVLTTPSSSASLIVSIHASARGIEASGDIAKDSALLGSVILQELFERTQRALLPSVIPSASGFDQQKLNTLFSSAVRRGQVGVIRAQALKSFLSPWTPFGKSLKLSYGDGRIYLLNPDGGDVVAVGYMLEDHRKEEAAASFSQAALGSSSEPAQAEGLLGKWKGTCRDLLRKLCK